MPAWLLPAIGVGLSGAGLGMSLFGGGGKTPDIDINAELARIDSLYEKARTQGIAAITQDFQAQRGELAQSQAARGILRSGVSQLGLARLGAARQQALSQFGSQLASSQAGQQSNLLNALLGRKTALDTAAAERERLGYNQLIGAGTGLLGSYLANRPTAPASSNAFNFAGSNMVAPSSSPRGFYQNEFGGGFGQNNLSGSQMLGPYPGY